MYAALLLMAPVLAADSARLELDEILLDNGLRVIVHEDHAAPIVAVRVMVRAGAADDPPDRAGAVHLLEHVLFTGSRSAPAGGLDLALAEAGGDANAWTHYDHLSFHTVVPPGALERALFLEADRLGWPTLAPEQVAVQREVVRAEANQLHDTPHGLDAAALALALYGSAHPYGRTLEGVRGPGGDARLAGLDGALLRSVHRDLLAPSRCVLVVAGDLDPGEVEGWVRASFGAIPSREPGEREHRPPEALSEEARWWLPADVGDERLYLAWRGVARAHADEPALGLLAWLLAGAEGSRLEERLVARGLASSVAAWSDSWRLGGGFVVSVSTPDAGLDKALWGVDRELARIAARGVTDLELSRARGAWRGGWLHAVQSTEARAEFLAQCALTRGEPDCLDARLSEVEAVSVEDLQRVARELVDAPGRVLLTVAARQEQALPASRRLEVP